MLLPDAEPGKRSGLCVRAVGGRHDGHRYRGDGQRPASRPGTFAWTVLSALAGAVDARVDDDSRVSITLHSSVPARRSWACGTRPAASVPAPDETGGERSLAIPLGSGHRRGRVAANRTGTRPRLRP